eukprot:77989_1
MSAFKNRKKKKSNAKNRKRQQNLQNKQKDKKNKKLTTANIDYEGFIYLSMSDEIPHWGVLRDSLIYIYLNKDNKDTIPYDIIHISHYCSITPLVKQHYFFAIEFFKENDQQSQFHWFFKNENNFQQWIKIIRKTLKISNIIKQNNQVTVNQKKK